MINITNPLTSGLSNSPHHAVHGHAHALCRAFTLKPIHEHITMKRNDIYPSKYLKAPDIGDREVTLTITHVGIEQLGPDRVERPVVHFHETTKGLVLNPTNFNTIAAVLRFPMRPMTGSDSTSPCALNGWRIAASSILQFA
jgi:hypothetical protein